MNTPSHGYRIEEGVYRMDWERVHEWLTSSYRSPGITRESIEKAARNSALVIGAFQDENVQVGYARVISDKTRFAYLCDVWVANEHRNKGLGRALVRYAVEHRDFTTTKWMLATRDAHRLYTAVGFKPLHPVESFLMRPAGESRPQQPTIAGEAQPMQIKEDDLRGPEIAELLTEHLRSLAEVSPPENRHALNLDELRKPDIQFWSVWIGNQLVGCGALKHLEPGQGEIKSMRTARPHLRKGVASFILQEIVAEAKRRGYSRLSLETGSMAYFEPAHRLYRKFGFRQCPPFGGYVDDPNSLFMTKQL